MADKQTEKNIRKLMSERHQRRVEKGLKKNRRYKRLIYNRFFLTLFMVLSQLVVYLLLSFHFYTEGGRIALFIIDLFAILMILYIINGNEKPSTKISWMLMILCLPIFGASMYFLFGEGKPTRKMHRKITEAKAENLPLLQKDQAAVDRIANSCPQAEICRYISNYGGYPVYDSGSVAYYPTGKEMYAEMLTEAEKAEKFILVEYFIIEHGKMWTPFFNLLLQKAKAGVKIRIIFDDVGCLFTLPPKYEHYLEAQHPNIRCIRFNRVKPIFTTRMNNRDHRKFLIIDGKVAFTGGINFADEYIDEKRRFGYWKDTGVKITGECVNAFTGMFFNLWNAFKPEKEPLTEFLVAPENNTVVSQNDGDRVETNEVKANKIPYFLQAYDDSPLDKENVAETVYLELINRSKNYLWIFTPYLIVDDFVRTALVNAAKRGVDVRIVTPAVPDKKAVFRLTRANYPPLLDAGVKIYEYTPGFIHAKSMLCDGECAIVGTVNLDYRSLYLHFENAVYFSDEQAIQDLKRDSEETFTLSKPIQKSDLKNSFFGKLFDSVLRVFETLL